MKFPIFVVGTCALAVVAMTPSTTAEIPADSALTCTFISGCTGSKCWGFGSWAVNAGYSAGAGRMLFKAICGEDIIATCEADTPGVNCHDGPHDSTSGTFACTWKTTYGYASHPQGGCVDPVSMHAFCQFAPEGQSYSATSLCTYI